MAERRRRGGYFDKVVWFPSGVRPGKTGFAASRDRKAMTELTFSLTWRAISPVPFIIDYRDIDTVNTPTIILFLELRKEFRGAEVVFAVGADVFAPEERYGSRCEVEAKWVEGYMLARTETFFVIPRRDYPHPDRLLLPFHRIVAPEYPKTAASSSMVRGLIARGEPFEHFVTEDVARYVKRRRLYKEDA